MKMKYLYQALSVFLIINCGGGGGSSSDSLPAPAQVITPQPLFKESSIKLIDAVSYYSSACNQPSFQFLIPTKINDDTYIDFIAHFWCDSSTPTEFDDLPVEDALVAYLSDGYGGYNIDNLDVFGSVSAKLGGASRKYSRGDLNGDGKDDFAFAMNWEDGRAAYDYDSMVANYAQPSILMSHESGYKIERIGKPDWGHSVQIKGTKVLFGGHSSQAFELIDSTWVDISEQFTDLSFASFLVFDDYIINSVRRNGLQGLELLEKNIVISSLMIEESFKVNFESWNNTGTGNYDELGVYNIRGENYFHGMTTEMCRQDDLIIATINASKLKSGEIIEGGYYSETETDPVVLFAFYQIENKALVEKQIEIIGEEINHNFNFFDCIDVNNDNKSDIVAQVFSQPWNDQDNNQGVPEVYINSDGSYFNLDTSTWPVYSVNDGSQGYLSDVDSNGTFDLVMFPLKANISGEVEIFLSNKNITN
ncbi:MAG: hypothetical protein EVA98_02580 [SAR86 cluster bacterium]|uniref:VCBS repeat-containing protein n=1 Tax=SAR86 cluster bacterium TaxID=2030880 RepID=A0A520MQY8_9GAMM|nr:MAG: hypothetical protein EVA98_02580 [SAR86 cluster bacterium]